MRFKINKTTLKSISELRKSIGSPKGKYFDQCAFSQANNSVRIASVPSRPALITVPRGIWPVYGEDGGRGQEWNAEREWMARSRTTVERRLIKLTLSEINNRGASRDPRCIMSSRVTPSAAPPCATTAAPRTRFFGWSAASVAGPFGLVTKAGDTFYCHFSSAWLFHALRGPVRPPLSSGHPVVRILSSLRL